MTSNSALAMALFDKPSTFMVTAGIFLLCLISVLSVKRRLARMAQTHKSPSERIAALKKAHTPDRSRIESVMVDAEELTRRLAAHLDNKAARLEKLLAEADQKIEALKEANAGASNGAASPQVVTRASMPGSRQRPSLSPEAPSDPVSKKIYDLADAGHQPVEIARKLEEHVGKVELILALRG